MDTQNNQESSQKSSIDPFIHRKIVVLYQDSPVKQAANAMCERGVGCVVVSDHAGHVVGIVTDRDLACTVLMGDFNPLLPLSEVMTHEPIRVEETATLEEVIHRMEENGVRRIPVIHGIHGDREKCVGMITLDDLIAARRIDINQVANVVRSQIRRHSISPVQKLRAWQAASRSEAHREHTLNRFYSVIGRHTGLQSDQVVVLSQVMLTSLVRRMHYTGAAHLIAQLPHDLQEDLLDLPAGPDRSITVTKIFHGVESRLGLNEESSKSLVRNFLGALNELMDRGQLEHAKAQLPEEIRELFPPRTGDGGERAPEVA